MTTTEHLNAIKAKCHELLTVAKKRTAGRWIYDPDNSMGGSCKYSNAPHMVWGPDGPGYGTVAQTCSDGLMPYPKGHQASDAAFIASTAGPFEASLRSTIAAIKGLSLLEDWKFTGWDGDAGIRSEASAVLDDILAAWPIELL